ncbi:MAG: hypothetical protein Q4G03_00860 [Planctomycetia bacterium]|nr:hypothetical protein [Planctomycetia bacterium]
MSKQKIEERNSLEQLLLRWQKSFENNKAKTYQLVAVVALVVLVVLVVRSGVFRGTNELNAVDAAYYSATLGSVVGGITDAEQLATIAQATKNPAEASAMKLTAGEAYLRAATQDIASAKAYSRGASSDNKEKPADPSVNFQLAVELFEAVSNAQNPLLKARANYDLGLAQEGLASVAANDEAVVAALDVAKERYSVASEIANTPYQRPAQTNLVNLQRKLTVDYYKSVANSFRTLPDPADAESILTGETELNVGEPLNVGEFDTADDDVTEATEDASAEEPPVEEVTPEVDEAPADPE